jgi:hypothetical protein
MADLPTQLSGLLHDAAETHHRVYAITDGDDPDWATWYSDWLVNLSPLDKIVGAKPVRSELTYLLVTLEKDFVQQAPNARWEEFYARRLLDHFAPHR